MLCTEFAPLALLPTNQIPSSDVLSAGAEYVPFGYNHEYVDLFPLKDKRNFEGVLGCYVGYDPNEHHPLYPTYQGLRSAYYDFVNQEDYRNGYLYRSEFANRGMWATKMQVHLVGYIAKAFDNLIQQASPTEAIHTIATYIEDQEVKCKTSYSEELDGRINYLATLDQAAEGPEPDEINGIPVLTSRTLGLLAGEVPESPEVKRQKEKEYTREQIDIARKRIQRVSFEAMSARVLTRLLQEAISS